MARSRSWQTFLKDQITITSGFQTMLSLSQLFNSVIYSWKVNNWMWLCSNETLFTKTVSLAITDDFFLKDQRSELKNTYSIWQLYDFW